LVLLGIMKIAATLMFFFISLFSFLLALDLL